MIKSKFGPITNPKTGMSKDIVINALSKESLKDILIGGGIVMVGITYLALSTFKNGAKAFETAEYETLESLELTVKDKRHLITDLKTEPAMALSFYPRLKCSTEVSERHVMLIFEKIPGGKFGKRFFERWGQNMELIICIIVGIIIGIVFGRRVFRSDVVGSLRVDQSDPDSGPYLFLELSHEGVDAIYKKKYVVLKVNIQDYISHE